MYKVPEKILGASTYSVFEQQFTSLALCIKKNQRELLKARLFNLVVRACAHQNGLNVHDIKAGRVVVLVDRLQLQLRFLSWVPLDVKVLAY
jgi:hypothetical protein